MTSKISSLRHSLPPKPQVAPTVPSEELARLNGSLTDEDRRRLFSQAHHTIPSSTPFSDPLLSPTTLSPDLTTCSTSMTSVRGDSSPLINSQSSMSAWRRSYFDSTKPVAFERSVTTTLPSAQPLSFSSSSSKDNDSREGHYRNHSMTDIAMLTEALSKTQMDQKTASGLTPYQYEQNCGHSQVQASPFFELRSEVGVAPLLIPMQASGDGLPLTSVVETLASKGSRAAAENPETVAHAWKLRQWGIGIGPGVNPKVATSRAGNHGRTRTVAEDPPIVNTGNSGPMCVQPGDWICTACGFVNWRRRKVCMRCYPFAEGNEVCQGIHGGELLAKKLAGGLDPTSEEFQQSLQALYPDRPKRTTEANPHHQNQMYESEQNQMKARDTFAFSEVSNVLGIHMNGPGTSPYSTYVPQTYLQENFTPRVYQPEPITHQSHSLVHENTASGAERFRLTHSFHEPTPELHKSIWAPAPKRPVPVPMDPEERNSSGQRAKLQPIGTKKSATYTSLNNINDDAKRIALADREFNHTDMKTNNGQTSVPT